MIVELAGVFIVGGIAGALIWTHGFRTGEARARARARWIAARSGR